MGLDQYAFARKENEEDIEIACWRKHANLEGWASDLYTTRGGAGEFNCVELQLFELDLMKLEKEHSTLEASSGFFWGTSNVHDTEDTQAFIEKALSMIQDGYKIIYTSWW